MPLDLDALGAPAAPRAVLAHRVTARAGRPPRRVGGHGAGGPGLALVRLALVALTAVLVLAGVGTRWSPGARGRAAAPAHAPVGPAAHDGTVGLVSCLRLPGHPGGVLTWSAAAPVPSGSADTALAPPPVPGRQPCAVAAGQPATGQLVAAQPVAGSS